MLVGQKINELMDSARLPEGVNFYDTGGVRIFPIYTGYGALTTNSAAYLIKRDGEKLMGSDLTFSLIQMCSGLDQKEFDALIDKALLEFRPIGPNGELLNNAVDASGRFEQD